MTFPIVHIEDVCEVNPKKSKSIVKNTEVSFLAMADVSESGEIINHRKRLYDEVQTGFTTFENSDILVAKITPCFENGKGALANNLINGFGFGSTEFHVIRANDKILPKYLFYITRSQRFKKEGEKNMTGSAGQKRIPASFIKKFKIPLPPLPIQQHIADTLDKADALRRKDQELLDKYDELAQAVFYEMFGDIKNRSKNWDWTSLESVLEDIVAGSSVGGEDKVLQNGELGVLKISAVTSGKFLKDEYKVPDQRLLPKNLIHPQKGDLLFSRANTRELVGATAIVESDCSNIFLPDKLWKLKPKPSVNSVSLKVILSEPSIKYELSKSATWTSGSMLNISMAKLRSLNIPLTSIDFQDSFAAMI